MLHNDYRSSLPSGENNAVDDEVAALRHAGIPVAEVRPSSDQLVGLSRPALLRHALSPIHSSQGVRSVREAISSFSPSVVHIHNLFPLLSPSVIDECVEARVPVVMSVHNYRMRCMNGILFRDGEVCTRCEEQASPWSGVRYGCYRDSHLQSMSMGLGIARHRQTWNRVSLFLAVSGFVGDRLVEWGIEPNRIMVKPNSVPDPGLSSAVGEGFLYAGRLDAEKGVREIVDAWQNSGLGAKSRLIIAGDGPLRAELEKRRTVSSGIELVGAVDRSDLSRLRRDTAVCVMATKMFEAHPSVGESYAHQRPVLATKFGALATVVDESVGWLASPSVDGLAAGFESCDDRSVCATKGLAARQRWEQQYAPRTVIPLLLNAYERAMESR